MRTYLANRVHDALRADEQAALLQQQAERLADEAAALELRRRNLAVKVGDWRAVSAGDQSHARELIDEADVLAAALRPDRSHDAKQEAA